jgi:hypothetical protein
VRRGHAKGLLFNYLRDYVQQSDGPAAWNGLVAELPNEDREAIGGLIIASGWYPIGAWNRIIDREMNRSPDPAAAMSRFCTYLGDRELNSLLKMVLKLGWPEFLLKRTGFLWSRYFDVGTFTAHEIEPRRWRLRLEDAPADEDVAVARLSCAYGPAPWLERGLHLSGTKTGHVEHTRCRWDGNPHCEFIARW